MTGQSIQTGAIYTWARQKIRNIPPYSMSSYLYLHDKFLVMFYEVSTMFEALASGPSVRTLTHNM